MRPLALSEPWITLGSALKMRLSASAVGPGWKKRTELPLAMLKLFQSMTACCVVWSMRRKFTAGWLTLACPDVTPRSCGSVLGGSCGPASAGGDARNCSATSHAGPRAIAARATRSIVLELGEQLELPARLPGGRARRGVERHAPVEHGRKRLERL